jgi:hypothetical protein
MALAISGSVHINASTAVVTTATLNAAVANCYIIVCILSNATGGPTGVAKGGGGAFTLIKSSAGAGGPNSNLDVYGFFSAGVYNDTVVVTMSSGSFTTVDAFGVSGSGQSSLVTEGSTYNGVDPVSITTTSANTMVIACFRESGASDPTAGSGFTIVPTAGHDYALVEYKLLASPATTSCTQTTGAGGANGAIAVAIPLFAAAAPGKGGTMSMMGV